MVHAKRVDKCLIGPNKRVNFPNGTFWSLGKIRGGEPRDRDNRREKNYRYSVLRVVGRAVDGDAANKTHWCLQLNGRDNEQIPIHSAVRFNLINIHVLIFPFGHCVASVATDYFTHARSSSFRGELRNYEEDTRAKKKKESERGPSNFILFAASPAYLFARLFCAC